MKFKRERERKTYSQIPLDGRRIADGKKLEMREERHPLRNKHRRAKVPFGQSQLFLLLHICDGLGHCFIYLPVGSPCVGAVMPRLPERRGKIYVAFDYRYPRSAWLIYSPSLFLYFFLFSGYSDRVQAKGQLSASTPRAGSEFVYKCRGSLVILYRFTSTRPVRGRLCSVASSTQKKMIYISMNCERNEILGEEAEQVIPIVQGEKNQKNKTQKKQCKRSHRWRICICTPPCYFPTLVKNKKSFFNVLHAALATAPLLHLSSVFSFRLYFELEASFLSR